MILKDISSLTVAKKQFIANFVEELKKIENIKAIALGGSHATGRANELSDVDLGIYYHEKQPFLIEDVKAVASKYSIGCEPVVVGFYEWGPWVNGGAWIHTEIGKIDILYRNIDQVENTIANAQLGKWENHYDQQPPYGFTSMIYLAESKTCLPLFDPNAILQGFKKIVKNYPQPLKESVINTSLWSAEFTLAHADGFALQKDLYNLLGCITRSLKGVTETLFALNDTYPISDKCAVQLLSKFEIVPNNLLEKINAILEVKLKSPEKNVALTKALFMEVVALTGEMYKPKFNFNK